MGIFDPADEAKIRELVRDAIPVADDARIPYDLAIDYLEGRQLTDVDGLLRQRFPSSMSGDSGQEIAAQCFQLTERYISESANAYDKGAKRKLVDEAGEESDATRAVSDATNRAMDACQADESLHSVDRYQNLFDSCGLWFGQKRAKLHLRMVFPHHSALVKGEEETFDDADQEDYRAYVVRLAAGSDPTKNRYGWASRSETAFFEGPSPKEVTRFLGGPYANPWFWPQAVQDDPTAKASIADRPLMPIVWWQRRTPACRILPTAESQIVQANRELNVAWSVLLDTYRFQGFDTPIKKLANPDNPKAKQRHGARFPVVLGLEESCDYMHSAVNFSDLVKMLSDFVRTNAMFLRMSGNDFAIDAQAATSGFSKLVDSLPKIEAREARLRRLRRMEAEMLWPRVCAILTWLGEIPADANKLRLVTEFPALEFPKTPDEIAKEIETDIKYNLDTPAHVYARRHGVSVEEAKAVVEENAKTNKELRGAEPEAPAAAQGQQPGSRLGGMIGRRTANGGRDRAPA